MKHFLFLRNRLWFDLIIAVAGIFMASQAFADIIHSGEIYSKYVQDPDPEAEYEQVGPDPDSWEWIAYDGNSGTGVQIGQTGAGSLFLTGDSSLGANSIDLGYESGSTGTLSIDGPGASFEFGYFYVGKGGEGTMSITNGATVVGIDRSTRVTIGGHRTHRDENGKQIRDEQGRTMYDYGTGTVFVDGENSLLSGKSLFVGRYSEGSLFVTDKGSARFEKDIKIGDSMDAFVTATGRVMVDGEGSSLVTEEDLLIGGSANGELAIANGADVTVYENFYIGNGSHGSGEVTVKGRGSTLTIGEDTYVSKQGTGVLNITDGGVVASNGDVSYIGYYKEKSKGAVIVNGEGSEWNNSGELYVGYNKKNKYDAPGTLSISDGGKVSTESVNVYNSDSVLTVDVNSSLSVGSGTGTITNNGTIRLVAGAGADPGAGNGPVSYTPMSFGSFDAESTGIVQALGGVWNEVYHTVTVVEAVEAYGGEAFTIDLSQNQRALITDSDTGMTAGVGFLADASPSIFEFTATALNDYSSLEGLMGTGEDILSAWKFSSSAYSDVLYLSLFAESAGDSILDLTIWQYLDDGWTEYDAAGLAFDGTYASFTASLTAMDRGSFGGSFAVSFFTENSSAVPEPGTLLLFGTGLLGLACIVRRKKR